MKFFFVSCFDIGEVPRRPGKWNWNWLYFLPFIFTFEQGEYSGTMGRLYDLPTIWWSNVSFDRLGTNWWDLGNSNCDLKNYFFTVSSKILCKCYLYIYFFFLVFVTLIPIWYALRPSQHPNVSLNYSQPIKINIGPSDSSMIKAVVSSSYYIILKIVSFSIGH